MIKNMIKKSLDKTIEIVKNMSIYEKILIIALIIIPIPFTMETYFIVKKVVKKCISCI